MLTPEQTEAVKALEEKHGRIGLVHSEDTKADGTYEWFVVLRKPTSAEYKQIKSLAHKEQSEKVTEAALRRLAVLPGASTPELDALLAEWPGIPDAAYPMYMKLSGGTGDARGKG